MKTVDEEEKRGKLAEWRTAQRSAVGDVRHCRQRWIVGEIDVLTGVGVDVGYQYRGLKADVGATPFGFREQNIVGGVQYKGGLTDKVSYRLTAARRAVTDSLLSYAGARDARRIWNGAA